MPQKYGALANAEPIVKSACLVCDDPSPSYSWTDYSGEGYCVQCGTPYQLKWGTLEAGDTYPRINIDAVWIPFLRRFWEEERIPNGCGTFLGFTHYPDQGRGRVAFQAWCRAHDAELPKRVTETDTTDTTEMLHDPE